MSLNRTASSLLLASAAFSVGCKQVPASTTTGKVVVHAVPSSTAAHVPAHDAAFFSPAQSGQAATVPAEPKLEDVEERKGPFAIGGQTFTVVLHRKRLGGKGSSEMALARLEIIDGAGVVEHREEFGYTMENGTFKEFCMETVDPLTGSNGAGLLVETGCLPSAPLSGGPWQVFGVINGKLSPLGKPIYAHGEMGEFVPGKINKIGNLTQILPDELRIRVYTGYFFVTVPIRVNWLAGRLELAQHCYYQTGQGMAEGGCEMPVEDVERHSGEQELSFVRMFSESNEQFGRPTHVVIKKDSKVDILACKVQVGWEEGKDNIGLGAGGDIWVKIRVDGKEGWIHSDEDLQAVGLYFSG